MPNLNPNTRINERMFNTFTLLPDGATAITTSTNPMAKQIDYAGGSNPVYIGVAAPGSATSAAVWQIQKITYSGSNPTAIQWANGSTAYNQIYDNRTSLTYS